MNPGSPGAKVFGCICTSLNGGVGDLSHRDACGARHVVVEACPVHGVMAWYGFAALMTAPPRPGPEPGMHVGGGLRAVPRGDVVELYEVNWNERGG